MKTPFEVYRATFTIIFFGSYCFFKRALTQTKWKEYFSGGRKYYYNVSFGTLCIYASSDLSYKTETKESKWDMPDELLLVLEKVEKEGTVPTGGANTILPARPNLSDDSVTPQNAVIPHNGFMPVEKVEKEGTPASTVLPARPNLPDDPVIPHNGFLTVEEGEKAFTHLMRKAGVDANWSWEQTMRATITDPLYKSLNTLAEKKACWEKVRGEHVVLLRLTHKKVPRLSTLMH